MGLPARPRRQRLRAHPGSPVELNVAARGEASAVVTTALAPALFGTTYLVATSGLLPQGRPLLLAALRLVPAAIALLVVVRPRLSRADLRAAALIGVPGMGLYMAFFFVAADRLPNGIAATVSNTTPLWVLGLGALVLGDRPPPARIGFAAGAVAGVALLVGASGEGLSAGGVACGLVSAALLAVGLVATRRRLAHVRPVDVAAVQLAVGSVVLVVLALTFERRGVEVDGGLLTGAAILSLVLTAVPYVLLFTGVRRIGPARTALLAPITPIVATVLGVLFRGEALTALQAAGLAVVLVCLVGAQRG